MAAPTVYTEAELQDYMLAILGETAVLLNWSGFNLAEAVNETLLAYGETDIADATDIQKLRAIARREAWRLAVDGINRFRFSTDQQSFDRQQVKEQAMKSLQLATANAATHDAAYAVVVGSAEHPQDPYVSRTDEERTF